MTFEFNPDGSLKVPESLAKEKEDNDKIFENEPCIRVIRDQVSSVTPLKCELTIEASDKLINFKRIEDLYDLATGKFKHAAKLSIQKINDKKYVVKIISGQFRCSWCEDFRKYLGEEMGVKVLNYGSCFFFTGSRKY